MATSCIYLDLDGVMIDLYGEVCRVLGGTGREPYERVPGIDHEVIWKEIIPEITGEEWTQDDLKKFFVDAGMEFWVDLPKYPWADELWELCNSVAPTVIMTSPWEIPSAAAGKMMWMNDNLPKLKRSAITDVKHHFSHPGAFLIDDRADTCELFRDPKYGGQAYTFPQPWSCLDWHGRDPLAELRALLLK